MSTFGRMASGAAASWIRIALSILVQVLLVPIFLRHWTPDMYGAWLAAFALMGFVNLFSLGFQNYVGNEFLQLVHKDREQMWALFFRSVRVGMAISTAEFLVVVVLVATSLVTKFIPASSAADQYGVAFTLVAYAFVYSAFNGVCGLIVRLLNALGYFPRMAWWGVWASLILALAPVLAVGFGGDIRDAGVALALGVLIYNLPTCWDMWRLLRTEGMPRIRAKGWAWKEARISLVLILKAILDMLRQQGVRLILAPLAGTANLAAFSTMRTGANVAMQGVGSITQPLLPELMRFLHNRDQERSEAAFASVWLVVCCCLVPGVLLLQAIAEPLYFRWTLGRIEFDSILFASLSLGVVVAAAAQPAVAIVQGHNLMKPQLVIMAVAGLCGLGGLYLLVPHMGIRGAGWALLAAELISAVGFIKIADSWMERQGLRWPRVSQLWVAGSVVVCGVGLVVVSRWPAYYFVRLGLSLGASALMALGYWRSMPELARSRLVSLCAGKFRKLSCVGLWALI